MDLRPHLRTVPDYPKTGINFIDITPLLSDAAALKAAADGLAEPFDPAEVDAVAGVEARGWIFASMLAERLHAGMVPIRKPGKLPYKKIAKTYELEYATSTIEIHTDAITPGARVLMIDDLLATGGTMSAACELIEQLGGQVVGCSFVVELCFLPGREVLAGRNIHTLVPIE